jgi:hypothetical protein
VRWGLIATAGVVGAATVAIAWSGARDSQLHALLEARAAAEDMSATSVDARLLLVGVGGHEAALAAMQTELAYIGIPYATVDAAALDGTALSDGTTHGLYNGVIAVACGIPNAPDPAAATALTAYLAAFHVREACLDAAADGRYGFGDAESVDTRAATMSLAYAAAGRTVFGWYATDAPVVVGGVTAAMAPPADASTTPLLVDGAGRPGVAVHAFADGRELLLVTFDQSAADAHTHQLLPGVASWVSRGVFVGEKRAFFGAQADDMFLGTVLHDGTTFRLGADDLRNVARWQTQARAQAAAGGLALTLPFNGVEVTDADPLTQAARDVGPQFHWLSHTFDHHRLDYADYARMTQELTSNDAVMSKYGFGPYDRPSLVTPDVSGLMNAQVMQAAADWGIAQLVCDASYKGCDPPVPNTAITNPLVGALLMIPRIPTSLYADVSVPDDWVAQYNALHGGQLAGPLTYDQILDVESDALLAHLAAGDMTPWMFHQANLRAYDGTHTLLTDLLDRLMAKYAALRVLPVVTLTMSDVGARLRARTALAAAGLVATVGPGPAITVSATQAITVPITGARAPNAETYGSVVISMVDVPAGGTVTLPLATMAGPSGGGGPGADPSSSGGCGCAVPGRASPALVSVPPVLLLTLGQLVRRRRAPRRQAPARPLTPAPRPGTPGTAPPGWPGSQCS